MLAFCGLNIAVIALTSVRQMVWEEPARPYSRHINPHISFLQPENTSMKYGILAKRFGGVVLSLQVLQSGAGYYIGTFDEEGPVSRGSEYFRTREEGQYALDNNTLLRENIHD